MNSTKHDSPSLYTNDCIVVGYGKQQLSSQQREVLGVWSPEMQGLWPGHWKFCREIQVVTG
jgi:hypothetical protein